ncbi:hypothetical protein ACVBKF_05260 [Shewanella sp. 0m-11]
MVNAVLHAVSLNDYWQLSGIFGWRLREGGNKKASVWLTLALYAV